MTRTAIVYRDDDTFPGYGADCDRCGIVFYSAPEWTTAAYAVRRHLGRHAVMDRHDRAGDGFRETDAGRAVARHVTRRTQ